MPNQSWDWYLVESYLFKINQSSILDSYNLVLTFAFPKGYHSTNAEYNEITPNILEIYDSGVSCMYVWLTKLYVRHLTKSIT